MAFFREVGEDIRNMVEKDPAARNGLEVLDMLSGDMGADNAQAGSLALPAQDKAFGQNNISADQVVHWDRDTPGSVHRKKMFYRPRHGYNNRRDHGDRR